MSGKKKKKKRIVVIREKIHGIDQKEEVQSIDIVSLMNKLQKNVVTLDYNFDKLVEHINKREPDEEQPPPYPE